MAKTMTPSGTEITSGQIGKLQELLGARLRKSGLQSEAVQKVLATQGDALADEMVEAVRTRAEATMFLAPRGMAGGTTTEAHNPDTFFRTREGLWVYDDFRSLVVAKAKPVEAGTVIKANAFELTRDLTDAEIEQALPTEHLFEEGPLCALIAGLITKQAKGEEGMLLNNGYANLFYTGSCVVGVRWYAAYRKWRVSAWQRDDGGWRAGIQVFSPATEA